MKTQIYRYWAQTQQKYSCLKLLDKVTTYCQFWVYEGLWRSMIWVTKCTSPYSLILYVKFSFLRKQEWINKFICSLLQPFLRLFSYFWLEITNFCLQWSWNADKCITGISRHPCLRYCWLTQHCLLLSTIRVLKSEITFFFIDISCSSNFRFSLNCLISSAIFLIASLNYFWKCKTRSMNWFFQETSRLDSRNRLTVHKKFRTRPTQFLSLFMLNLRLVSRGFRELTAWLKAISA